MRATRCPASAASSSDGDADRRRRPRRRRPIRGRARRALRLVPLGRRDVQHLQGRTARSAGSTAASSPSRTRIRTSREVLARCEELRVETDGYFDVARRRRRLDPSGLVKGWSVDRGAALLDARRPPQLRDQRRRRHSARGRAVPERAWRVGIQHPLEHDRSRRRSSRRPTSRSRPRARTPAATTSSTRTPAGRPAGVLSVTITGPDLGTADAYATAAFAMGGAGAPTGPRTCAATRR